MDDASNRSNVLQKIVGREVKIGVVGMGYVGLASAGAFVAAGYEVVGVDSDEARVREIATLAEPLLSADLDLRRELGAAIHARRFRVVTDYAALAVCNVVVLCVPTPAT